MYTCLLQAQLIKSNITAVLGVGFISDFATLVSLLVPISNLLKSKSNEMILLLYAS